MRVTVGGGGAFDTVTITDADVVLFPAASRATAASACLLPSAAVVVSQVISYGAVTSSAPSGDPSSVNWTPATPTSSAAVADTVVVPDTVASETGEVIATVGGV